MRRAISGSDGFSEKKKDDYIVFNYQFSQPDTFPDPNTAPGKEDVQIGTDGFR